MTLLDNALNQTATYWAFAGNSGEGHATFSSPTAISCRWDDMQELFTNYMGDEVMSNAMIITSSDLTVRSFIYLGTSTTASPYDVSGAYEIQKFQKLPDIAASEYVRIATV